MRALLTRSDHVIVVSPCYQSLLSIASTLCSIDMIDLVAEEGWFLDLDKLECLIRSNTKVIIINFPHNPTGTIISRLELESLIGLARQRNIWVFSDEVYRGIETDPNDRLPPVQHSL